MQSVERDAGEWLASRREASIIVGLTRNGVREVWAFRSPDAQFAPVPTESTIYEIGSVSKIYLATILAELERRGVLSLDDPISKWLPNGDRLKPEIGALTIRHLATHSSGLPSMGKRHTEIAASETMGQWQAPFGAYTHYLRYKKEHLYADWEDAEFIYPTGEGWLYCVMGMGTVGHILELATGQTFDELLREIVAEPLGLHDTAYELSLAQVARIQHAYTSDGAATPNWYHDVLMPQGGLRSTMTDMLTFAEAHLSNDGPLVDAMARTRESHYRLPASALEVPPDSPWTDEINHGLAWRLFDGGACHSGTTLFYSTGFAVNADAGVGLVMLSTSYDNLAHHGVLNPIFLNWFKEACA